MISSNTRATRSRYSSPQQPPNGSGSGGGGGPLESSRSSAANEGHQRTFMQRWLEPTVQNKASFEEAGLMRYGVMENMAPLGTLPKATAAAAATSAAGTTLSASSGANKRSDATTGTTGTAATPIRKIILKPTRPSTALAAEDAGNSTSGKPNGGSAMATGSLASPVDGTRQSRRALPNKDADDEDYDPKGGSSRAWAGQRASLSRRSLSRPSAGRQSSSSTTQAQPQPQQQQQQQRQAAQQQASAAAAQAAQATSSEEPSSRPSEESNEKIGRIVDEAIEEALRHYRYPTAWALRTLYDENQGSARFLSMVEDVYSQTADADTLDEFSRLVEDRKREGKKGNKGCYYFVPQTTTHSRSTPRKPRPAPYGALLLSSNGKSTSASTPGARGGAHQQRHHRSRSDGLEEPASKKIKTRHLDHRVTPKQRSRNANGINGSSATPSRSRRSRRTEMDSDSELSPAISMSSPDNLSDGYDFNDDDDDGEDENGNEAPSPTAHASAAAAPSRGGGGVGGGAGGGVRRGAGGTAPASAGGRQPMVARRGSLASASRTAGSSDLSTPTSPTPRAAAASSSHNRAHHAHQNSHPHSRSHSHSSRRASMPGVVDPAPFPNISSSSSSKKARGAAAASAAVIGAPAAKGQQHAGKAASATAVSSSSTRGGAGGAAGAAAAREEDRDGPRPEDAAADRRQEAKLATQRRTTQNVSNVRAMAVRKKGEETEEDGAVDEDDGDDDDGFAPTSKRRRAPRQSMGNLAPPAGGVGSGRGRVTRSSNKRNHDEYEEAVSPTTLFFPAPSVSKTPSRAATPLDPPLAKRQRRGPKTKTSPVKKGGNNMAPTGGRAPADAGPNGSEASNDIDNHDDYCSACGHDGELVCCDHCSRSFHFECVDLDPSGPLPDEWFCGVCASQRPASQPANKGAFATFLTGLDKSNPKEFSLPGRLKNYFEGVKNGPEGVYEDVQPVAAKPVKKKNGYEEAPDFFRLRDNDGNLVLCHNCHKPTSANRAIIPCSACGLYWHLDCLSPPLAIPPPLRSWVCPAHVDDLLAELPVSLAPAHKHRKIKGAPEIRPAFGRGMPNNGFIEIDFEDEDESDGDSGWRDVKQFGRTMRLPKKGVVLDFISQIHKREEEANAASLAVSSNAGVTENIVSTLLSSISSPVDGSDGSGGGPPNKLNELAELVALNAPAVIYKAIAQGAPQNLALGELTTADRQSLLALQAQIEAINDRIQSILGATAAPATETPAAETATASPVAPEAEPDAEPTADVSMQDAEDAEEPQDNNTVDVAAAEPDADDEDDAAQLAEGGLSALADAAMADIEMSEPTAADAGVDNAAVVPKIDDAADATDAADAAADVGAPSTVVAPDTADIAEASEKNVEVAEDSAPAEVAEDPPIADAREGTPTPEAAKDDELIKITSSPVQKAESPEREVASEEKPSALTEQEAMPDESEAKIDAETAEEEAAADKVADEAGGSEDGAEDAPAVIVLD